MPTPIVCGTFSCYAYSHFNGRTGAQTRGAEVGDVCCGGGAVMKP